MHFFSLNSCLKLSFPLSARIQTFLSMTILHHKLLTGEGRVLANGWTHPSSMTISVHLFMTSITRKVAIKYHLTLNIKFSVAIGIFSIVQIWAFVYVLIRPFQYRIQSAGIYIYKYIIHLYLYNDQLTMMWRNCALCLPIREQGGHGWWFNGVFFIQPRGQDKNVYQLLQKKPSIISLPILGARWKLRYHHTSSFFYTLNSVVSHLWQPKVHVILRSFVVLTWMHDIVEFV